MGFVGASSRNTVKDDSAPRNTSSAKSNSDSYFNHTVQSLDLTNDKQGAVAFDSASGKYVAVDGSTVTVTNTYTVALADTAQQNAQAINIVNASSAMASHRAPRRRWRRIPYFILP